MGANEGTGWSVVLEGVERSNWLRSVLKWLDPVVILRDRGSSGLVVEEVRCQWFRELGCVCEMRAVENLEKDGEYILK